MNGENDYDQRDAGYDKVRKLLEECKVEEKIIAKFMAEEIDWETLVLLEDGDFNSLKVPMGPLLKLKKRIRAVNQEAAAKAGEAKASRAENSNENRPETPPPVTFGNVPPKPPRAVTPPPTMAPIVFGAMTPPRSDYCVAEPPIPPLQALAPVLPVRTPAPAPMLTPAPVAAPSAAYVPVPALQRIPQGTEEGGWEVPKAGGPRGCATARMTTTLAAGAGVSALRTLMESGRPGLIFGATKQTFEECIDRGLFGLPPSHSGSHVTRLRQQYTAAGDGATPLFLYDYTNKTLHGVFVNDGESGEPLVSNAWDIKKSWPRPAHLPPAPPTTFTVQTRFRIVHRVQPLAESEWSRHVRRAGPRAPKMALDAAATRSLLDAFARQAPLDPTCTLARTGSVGGGSTAGLYGGGGGGGGAHGGSTARQSRVPRQPGSA